MKNNFIYIFNLRLIPILFLCTVWIIKGYEYIYNTTFTNFAIKPGDVNSLYNIFTFPFIHADFSHLLNNTFPLIVLSFIIVSVYKKIATKIFVYSYILSGIIFWFIGDLTPVIGSSGIVYSLGSFILVSGFIKNQPRLAILSFLVIFLNFFNLWGIIEIKQDNISQTAHLAGAISGMVLAIIFRKKGPQPKVYNYEIEEEIERKNINYIYKKSS
tara:strand:- start:4 stop:645 length:642 start_codon:yes stop_codon:yes gene_type:complete